VGEQVGVRCTGGGASDTALRAVVRHVGRVRDLPRIGLALAPDAPRALGAQFDCPETLLGFEALEERVVEPRPGWRFRSHLIVLDAERLVTHPPATTTLAAMASAVDFAGLLEAAA
jgi:hypothetical protein